MWVVRNERRGYEDVLLGKKGTAREKFRFPRRRE
jgi:hypothetical protein